MVPAVFTRCGGTIVEPAGFGAGGLAAGLIGGFTGAWAMVTGLTAGLAAGFAVGFTAGLAAVVMGLVAKGGRTAGLAESLLMSRRLVGPMCGIWGAETAGAITGAVTGTAIAGWETGADASGAPLVVPITGAASRPFITGAFAGCLLMGAPIGSAGWTLIGSAGADCAVFSGWAGAGVTMVGCSCVVGRAAGWIAGVVWG